MSLLQLSLYKKTDKRKMRYLLLTFDIEEFDLPLEYNIKINDKEKFEISFEGTKIILDLLNIAKIKATFFVTASFAKKYREIIKKISENHEIALHAYTHRQNYAQMSSKKAKYFLVKAKRIIEEITKKELVGFRAPRMQKPTYHVMRDIGIKYDSSLHPTYVPGRYNNLLKNRGSFFIENVLEVPISVIPLFRLPFSFLWFRNIGLGYAKICTRLSLIGSDYVNIYFHPWEFVNLEKLKYSDRLPKLIIRNTGEILEKNIKKYIYWCKRNKIKVIRMKDYYKMSKKE